MFIVQSQTCASQVINDVVNRSLGGVLSGSQHVKYNCCQPLNMHADLIDSACNYTLNHPLIDQVRIFLHGVLHNHHVLESSYRFSLEHLMGQVKHRFPFVRIIIESHWDITRCDCDRIPNHSDQQIDGVLPTALHSNERNFPLTSQS